jgi:ribosomal protein L16 Arg81 hydroxylase
VPAGRHVEGERGTPRVEEPAELLAEFDLRPGDAIYIPRGYVHDAVATDSTSLHLTVGM